MSVSIAELRRLNMNNIRRSVGGRFVSRRARRFNPLQFEPVNSKPVQCVVTYSQPTEGDENSQYFESQHCKVTFRALPVRGCVSVSESSPCIPESPPASPRADEFEVEWHMPDWIDEGTKDSPIEID